ncbi:replicative DNA helicase [Flavobacterium sp.]|uniref:replicative DNA helicase n=1 Tax=Flavobacterium sp. TaxID=239 RepID=UPI002634E5C7|nr:replicative DNA helicase [Flavobacterium sp.]
MEQFKNKEKSNTDFNMKVVQLEQVKLPPSVIELEEAVLGAMMIDVKGVDECLMVLKNSDCFYKEAHKFIFDAICDLYNDNQPIDILTVSARLRSVGKLEAVGGDFFLIQLTQKISSSAHIEYHSRIILQMFIKRWIIKSSAEFMSLAYDDEIDSLELLNDWSNALDSIVEMSMQGKKNVSYSEALEVVEKRVEFLSNNPENEVTGIRTGFPVMDRFTGGYQPGELVISAARPGMGKTAESLKMVVENAKAGVPGGIISAEMSIYSLVARTVAIDTNFHLSQLTKKGFGDNKNYFQTLNRHKHRMKEFPIYIDDSPSPDIRNVIATARLWKRKYKIKYLVVDYLQLLCDATKVNRSGNREQEIASISRKLKALAKELEIPVIALSQVSRECESRSGNKRPNLRDLRESGAIEQDADIVKFIYRAGYYGFEVDDEILQAGADTEIIFAKYREGAPDTTIGLKWIGDKTKFIDPAEWVDEKDPNERHNDRVPTAQPSEAFESGDKNMSDDNGLDTPF